MNAERLLEHFDRISDAADAVPRLRRFVLDLAVQGRLLRPEGASGPNRLRAKACSFHAQAVWQIPSHWVFVEVHQLAGSSGLFIDGDWVESKDQDPAGTIRLTQLADVGVGTFRDRSARFMNEETAVRLGCTFLAPGDVLIARMPDPLGRACIFPGDERRCVTVVDVAILRPERDAIDPVFVVHAINSRLFAKNVAAKAAGTTRSRISRGNLAKLPFPLPPLAEQRRIVAKVAELMALCDRLEAAQAEREARRDRLVSASLARVTQPASQAPSSALASARFHLNHFDRLTTRPEHVKKLRQTILNLAVRGRLVPQDSKDEAAAKLLNTLRASHGERDRRLATDDGSPHETPPSWVWAYLDDLVVFGPQNGISPKPTDSESAPKAITLTATTSGRFDNRYFKHVDVRVPDTSEYWLRDGDLLFQRGNTREYVGIAAVYTGPPQTFLYPDLMMKVRLSPMIDLRFAHLAVTAPPARAYFGANATGAQASMPKINQTILVSLPIPLPPLAEQRRIVEKVDELMALCDRLEASLASAATDRVRLLEAMLRDALVPAV